MVDRALRRRLVALIYAEAWTLGLLRREARIAGTNVGTFLTNFSEQLHVLVAENLRSAVFLKLVEEFLSMRPSLVTFTGAYVIGNQVPVFTELEQGFYEKTMFFISPAPAFSALH